MIWRFPGHNGWWQANPFSLSAAPDGRTLRLTAKAVGATSSGLRHLRVGNRVFAEGPYGAFTSLHQVTPVTRGERVASFFWIQSMVREDAQRRLMYEMDLSIRRLTQDVPDHPALVQLTGVYHNLLRRWADA